MLGKVPAAVHGEINQAMAPLMAWEMITGAAEAVAFLLLPLLAFIALVAVVAQREWAAAGGILVILCILVVIAVIARATGFLNPLFEVIEKLR